MTTILLLSLGLAGVTVCWGFVLHKLLYWRNRALYAESLEHQRFLQQFQQAGQSYSGLAKPANVAKDGQ